MRQLADVQTISTEKVEGVVDDGDADAGWVSEMGSRNDTPTPNVRKWEIAAHEMYAMPKVTQKLIDDAAVDVEAWLAGKVADKFARVEGAAWQPRLGHLRAHQHRRQRCVPHHAVRSPPGPAGRHEGSLPAERAVADAP